MPEAINKSTPKARKEHTCDYCIEKINKGEVYEKTKMVSDGHLWTWKNHVHCQKIAEHFKMFDECGEEGLSTEGFLETIFQIYREKNPEVEWNRGEFIPSAIEHCLKLIEDVREI